MTKVARIVFGLAELTTLFFAWLPLPPTPDACAPPRSRRICHCEKPIWPKIDYVTPGIFAETLDALFAPATESTVRGSRVKVSKTSVGAAEAKDRHAAVARIIAGSMSKGD
jgi:hypothetical protein